MQEEDTGDASKTAAPAMLQQPPVQHSAEEQALQPSAADGQKGGAELVGKVSRRINLAAVSSADMPSAKRHRVSHTAAPGLQQVQESPVAHSSAVDAAQEEVQQQTSAQEEVHQQQISEAARQLILEALQESRERKPSPGATQAIPEQGLESPEYVEQSPEKGQQVQKGLQLSPPVGNLPQRQALQSQGKRQRFPEREQQPAADVQQPAADVQQLAGTDAAALQLAADQIQAVQHDVNSHEGALPSGASSPRAALSPKRRRRVCFADLEGVSEVRGPASEQGAGAEGETGAQEGAVTEVVPATSHPAMVSSANR